MKNRPNKWVAAVLGLVSPPISLLYVAEYVWAAIYFLASLCVAVLAFVLLHRAPVVAAALVWGINVVSAVHSYRLARAYPGDKIRPIYSRWYGLLGIYLCLFAVIFGFRSFLFEPFRFPSGSMIPTIEPGSYLIVKKWGYGHYGTYGLTPFQREISAELHRGDIIAFDYPEDRSVQYVKRLIALPGDRVAYLDKKLSINGKLVPQDQIDEYFDGSIHESVLKFEESIEGNRYFVMRNQDAGTNTSVLSDHVSSFKSMDKCKYGAHGVTCEVPAGHYYAMGDNRDNSRDSRYWGFVPSDHIIGKVLYILRPSQ